MVFSSSSLVALVAVLVAMTGLVAMVVPVVVAVVTVPGFMICASCCLATVTVGDETAAVARGDTRIMGLPLVAVVTVGSWMLETAGRDTAAADAGTTVALLPGPFNTELKRNIYTFICMAPKSVIKLNFNLRC